MSQYFNIVPNKAACASSLAAKERGNAFFKAGDYTSAIREYTEGVNSLATKVYPSHLSAGSGETRGSEDTDGGARNLFAVLHSNRAAAHAAAGNARQSLADATEACRVEPNWAKAHSRRAKALFALKEFKQSAQAYAQALGAANKNLAVATDKHNRAMEVIGKQADAQSSEYMRLLEENASMRRRLEDYDLMFGGMAKKNK